MSQSTYHLAKKSGSSRHGHELIGRRVVGPCWETIGRRRCCIWPFYETFSIKFGWRRKRINAQEKDENGDQIDFFGFIGGGGGQGRRPFWLKWMDPRKRENMAENENLVSFNRIFEKFRK